MEIMKDFTFLISSSVEREKLSCEIYFKEEFMAEISQETDNLLLEIYEPKEKWWSMPLEDFLKA